jgi:hypothetical protein
MNDIRTWDQVRNEEAKERHSELEAVREEHKHIKLANGFILYSRDLITGREVVSVFGPEPGSKKTGFRGSIQLGLK